MIEAALARSGGVLAQAAADLGLSRQALYRRLDRLGIPSDLMRVLRVLPIAVRMIAIAAAGIGGHRRGHRAAGALAGSPGPRRCWRRRPSARWWAP